MIMMVLRFLDGGPQPVLRRLQACARKRRATAAFRNLVAAGAPIILDLGSGGPGRPGTVGVDLASTADIVHDLTAGVPLPDGCVQAIYSDHFLEHLHLIQVVEILRECHRVLVNGGRLRFTVPHIDPYLDAYRSGDMAFLEAKITDVPKAHADLYSTPFDLLAWLLLRDGDHRSIFDRESIVAKVRAAGFAAVTTDTFDPEVDGTQRFSSVYIEARK